MSYFLLYTLMRKKKIVYKGTYDFIRIEKDSTITVNDGTASMNVKLIGVDIPVAVPENDTADAETGNAAGSRAAEYMEQLLDGKKIYLECDVAETDENGHILAYLYLDDKKTLYENRFFIITMDKGKTMLNKMLLEKGLARYAPAEPNTKYAGEFAELENTAQKKGEGFWGTETFGRED